MFKRALLLAVSLLAASHSYAQTADKPPFPRLAILATGSPHDYHLPERQAQLARYNISLIQGYPGWESWRGTTYDQVTKNIKAKNPNAKVFVYVNDNEADTSANAASVWVDLLAALNTNRWWLYDSGAPAKSTFGTTTYLTNPTLYAPKNAAGQRYVDWLPSYLVKTFNMTSSAVDGFFLDNMFWQPHRNGDWNNDGVTDQATDPNVSRWLREGNRQYFNNLKALLPGKQQFANAVDWVDPGSVLTEYQNLIHGALLEACIGVSWSTESWRGWQATMDAYRKTMSTLVAPKMAIVGYAGYANDYRGLRYGLGTTLLDDGYFAFGTKFNDSEYDTHDAVWFDEFDVSLGQATSSPPTAAWQKGVYRRDFENGIVLVNPKGNGAQDITLEGDFKRIQGKQDPVTNNGKTGRAVHLEDRDGIILLRLTAVKRPASPTNVTIQ